MSSLPKTKPENEQTSVTARLAREVVKVAEEIESLVDIQTGQIGNQDMMRLQQIDFCSQKLNDIARMIEEFDLLEGTPDPERTARFRQVAKLEYFQELLESK